MKLITKAISDALTATPLNSTDGTPTHKKRVLEKFFNCAGIGTWIVFEAEKLADGEWMFFGLADLGCPELGYFKLSDLQGALGLRLERDMYSPAHAFVTNGILCEAAG